MMSLVFDLDMTFETDEAVNIKNQPVGLILLFAFSHETSNVKFHDAD